MLAELDLMVGLAQPQEGVFGARMTGGGFGGSTINIVSTRNVDAFKKKIADDYAKETGLEPEIYIVKPAHGVERAVSETTGITN